jgi:putative transposase
MNTDYIKDEHRVHLIIYHLIWCPKRRKPVLIDDVATECEKLIREKCDQNGWEVLELAIQPDHVHLFIRSFPTVPASLIIKECKGITGFHLRKQFKELLKLPCLWTKSYFASTAGNVSAETIQKYIEAQSKT